MPWSERSKQDNPSRPAEHTQILATTLLRGRAASDSAAAGPPLAHEWSLPALHWPYRGPFASALRWRAIRR